MRNFGEIEKELREERGYTLEEVAIGTGLSKAAISRYENGEREPAFHLIKYFCLFYNVSSDYLLGLVNDRQGRYPDYVLKDGTIIEVKAGPRTAQAKDRNENEENVG